MEHTPLVNAIVDVLFNEDEIQSTAYHTATPDVEDRMVKCLRCFGVRQKR